MERLPKLIDEYLQDLPSIMEHVPRRALREATPVKTPMASPHMPATEIEKVTPGTYRKRTPEEMDVLRREVDRDRAERYAWLYAKLGFRVVVFPDGTLEITWRGGVSTLEGIPTTTPRLTSATTPSCSKG